MISQPPRGLQTLAGFPFAVAHSAGAEDVARRVAARAQQAHAFLREQLSFDPQFLVLVLSPEDWVVHADVPTYSMPHTSHADTLVVGDRPGAFMLNMARIIEETAGDEGLRQFASLYPSRDGIPDLSSLTDLFAVHELAHLFHEQVPFDFPRPWLQELFPNLCMHAYVASREPDMLPALQTLPALMAEVPPERWQHRTLADFDQHYVAVAPENYGWFQCRFMAGSRQIYEEGGDNALRGLYTAFANGARQEIADGDLEALLRDQVTPAAARLMLDWPR